MERPLRPTPPERPLVGMSRVLGSRKSASSSKPVRHRALWCAVSLTADWQAQAGHKLSNSSTLGQGAALRSRRAALSARNHSDRHRQEMAEAAGKISSLKAGDPPSKMDENAKGVRAIVGVYWLWVVTQQAAGLSSLLLVDHKLNRRPFFEVTEVSRLVLEGAGNTLETSNSILADSSHYKLANPAAIATICKLSTTNCCLNKHPQATSNTAPAPMALTPFGFPSVFNGESCCPQGALLSLLPSSNCLCLKPLRLPEASALPPEPASLPSGTRRSTL